MVRTTTTPRGRPAAAHPARDRGRTTRRLGALERRLEVEDRADRLAGDDTPGGEAAAVADPIDLVADRLGGVAATDEVGRSECTIVVVDGRRTPRAAPGRRSVRRTVRPTGTAARSRHRCLHRVTRDRTRPESMNHRHDIGVYSMSWQQRGPKGPMSDEHKAALAQGGRGQGCPRLSRCACGPTSPSGAASARRIRSRSGSPRSTTELATPTRSTSCASSRSAATWPTSWRRWAARSTSAASRRVRRGRQVLQRAPGHLVRDVA